MLQPQNDTRLFITHIYYIIIFALHRQNNIEKINKIMVITLHISPLYFDKLHAELNFVRRKQQIMTP